MSQYFLKTNRLGFRKWTEGDLPIALTLWGDHDVTRLIDARGKLSEVQVKEKLAEEIAIEKEHGVQYFPIFLLRTDEHVGCCGVRPYDLDKGLYEIGFHIVKKFWRQGFAHESAKAMIEYAFDKLKAAGLFAGHHPNNKASKLLLEKLGFHYTHDEYYAQTGLEHPSYLLSANKGMPITA